VGDVFKGIPIDVIQRPYLYYGTTIAKYKNQNLIKLIDIIKEGF